MDIVDVSHRMAEPAIQAIFSLAVGYPTPDKLAALAQRYASEPSWCAWGSFDSTEPVGVLGLELQAHGRAVIRYISVAPSRQRTGIGKRLIEDVRARHELVELYAETHTDAVPFYRRCGFVVSSLGELWPGVERFGCRWTGA